MMEKLKNLTLLALVMLLSSCLYQPGNCGKCVSQKLYFEYKDAAGNDLLNQYVSSARLYIYDDSGAFVKKIDVTNTELSMNDGIELDMASEGLYKVICFANTSSESVITNIDSFSNAKLSLSESSKSADPLYYGLANFSVLKNRPENVLVKLNSIHVRFELAVKGFDEDSAPNVEFQKGVSSYNFYGAPIKLSSREHMVLNGAYNSDKKAMVYSFNFLKPASKDRAMNFVLNHESLNEPNTFSLNDFISDKYPNVNIADQLKEIKLEMLIEFKGIDIEISIPDWDSIDTGAGGVS